ncbi:hypothetical protein M1615_01065 [Patescibacteria group bacterium]|nr:hypothetical protein [Patescibacteria group bacterium]MCL5010468.1 hypothetical protein [Patescibacteria group bacterium]
MNKERPYYHPDPRRTVRNRSYHPRGEPKLTRRDFSETLAKTTIVLAGVTALAATIAKLINLPDQLEDLETRIKIDNLEHPKAGSYLVRNKENGRWEISDKPGPVERGRLTPATNATGQLLNKGNIPIRNNYPVLGFNETNLKPNPANQDIYYITVVGDPYPSSDENGKPGDIPIYNHGVLAKNPKGIWAKLVTEDGLPADIDGRALIPTKENPHPEPLFVAMNFVGPRPPSPAGSPAK